MDENQDVVHLPAVIAERFGTSRSEARRCIVQGAVKIDGEIVGTCDWKREELAGRTLTLGKRRKVTL
jgi:tyrosyl-tRNA synthetase